MLCTMVIIKHVHMMEDNVLHVIIDEAIMNASNKSNTETIKFRVQYEPNRTIVSGCYNIIVTLQALHLE